MYEPYIESVSLFVNGAQTFTRYHSHLSASIGNCIGKVIKKIDHARKFCSDFIRNYPPNRNVYV